MNTRTARGGPTDEATDTIIAAVEGDLPLPPRGVPRPTLDREQREIKDTLLRASSLVEVAIGSTVEALETHDAARAQAVVDGDVAVNAMTAAAIEEVVSTIATQSPSRATCASCSRYTTLRSSWSGSATMWRTSRSGSATSRPSQACRPAPAWRDGPARRRDPGRRDASARGL